MSVTDRSLQETRDTTLTLSDLSVRGEPALPGCLVHLSAHSTAPTAVMQTGVDANDRKCLLGVPLLHVLPRSQEGESHKAKALKEVWL